MRLLFSQAAQLRESASRQKELQQKLATAEKNVHIKNNYEKFIEEVNTAPLYVSSMSCTYYDCTQFESRWVKNHENPPQDEDAIEKKKEVLEQYDEELKSREKTIVLQKVNRKGVVH